MVDGGGGAVRDSGRRSPPPPTEPEEVIDLDDLVDAPAEPARTAVDALTDAFPGAEVVEEEHDDP